MNKVIARIARKTVAGSKVYMGEESLRLTDAEQRVHNARMAKARAGNFDFSKCMVEAPAVINAVEVD